MSGCGADIRANELVEELVDDASFEMPTVDLTDPNYGLPCLEGLEAPITKLSNDDLTTRVVGGTGTFDVLMQALNAHLKEQFDKQRLTGEQYSKAYVALTEGAMGQAVQFLLSRESSYWQAVTAREQAKVAQAQAVTARVQLETAKVQLVALKLESETQKATFALTKMKLATEDLGYCTSKYQLDNILPAQLKLINEQVEAQRAQTLDTRSDGTTPVAGSIGKQKDLYGQQIISYQRDAEVKVAKLFTDSWITQKTIDEGLLAPDAFTNVSLNAILETLKTVNNLGV